MWFMYTILTFICWGVADLFYKMGNQGEGEYHHLKTGIMVGLVMGIHATIFILFNHSSVDVMDVIRYLPISLCYIVSMIVSYRGMKYLELSIVSPVENTSGVITALLLLIFFKEIFDFPFYIAVFLIFVGIFIISMLELKEGRKEREEYKKKNPLSRIFTLTILFPLTYCFLDGLGTFLDGVFLDKLELVSEDSALIAYEYTFAFYAFVTYFYLKWKKQDFHIFQEKPKLWAALFETGGQFFYVYSMAENSTVAAPIVGSYCVLSLLLSHVFLHEKLSKKQYVAITLVLIGVFILAVLDV